uniref:AlNc14C204G8778 protein n=1 Tax=Albugo laibachii Nc14 TaxID=890382 RepID=F0WQW9_9STRA|nr:AlNc14C204G8778 [Albugo laibachii Nc14]|eukprot:CCA23728.1 AlNc14C204G8778 [Albugo laibachii Nc14]
MSTIFFIAVILGKVIVVVKNKTKRVAFQGHLLEAIIIATVKIREEMIERVLNAAMVTKVANDIVPELECCGAALVLSLLAAIDTLLLATDWLVSHGSDNRYVFCRHELTLNFLELLPQKSPK